MEVNGRFLLSNIPFCWCERHSGTPYSLRKIYRIGISVFVFVLMLSPLIAQDQRKKGTPYGPRPGGTPAVSEQSQSSEDSGEQNQFQKRQEKFESKPLQRNETSEESSEEEESILSQEPPESSPNYYGIALWTTVIVGIILLIFAAIRWFKPVGQSIFAQPGIEILSSSSLTKNAQVFLLQIGERILKVGVSSDSITLLGEVSDPDEVALIRSECKKESSFSKRFQEALEDSAEPGSRRNQTHQSREGEREDPMGEIDKEISGIRKLLQSWKQQ